MNLKSIYICVPSYAAHGPQAVYGFVNSVKALAEKYGFSVELSPLLSVYRRRKSSHDKDLRREDIQTAFKHDLIIPFYAGYGAIDLAPLVLDMLSTAKRHPLLCGFSDVSVFHACWAIKGNERSFYGKLPVDISAPSRECASLSAWLESKQLTYSNDIEAGVKVVREGTAYGICYATNLRILSSLVGTPFFPCLTNCILAIEDYGLKPYLIDLAFFQLYHAGVLSGVVAIIAGEFGIDDTYLPYGSLTVEEILIKWAHILDIPVLSHFPFGHQEDSYGFPCATKAQIKCFDNGKWELII